MAEVTITKDGKRGRIDEAKLSAALARGWSRAAAPTAPPPPTPDAAAPSFGERALKKFIDVNEGAGQGFLKQASMGLDDEVARIAARLGTTVQRQSDSDDAMLSGGGESVLESWRKSAGAGQEAADERRAEVDRAFEKAPIAYGAGSLAGLGTAIAAGPGGAKTALGRAGQGAALGAIGGAGMSDADSLAEAAPSAAGGAALGGALGAGVPLAARGLGAIRGVLAPGLRKAAGDVPVGMRRAGDALEDLVTRTNTENPLVQMVTSGPRAAASVAGKTLKGIAGPAPVQPASQSLAPLVDDDVAARLLADIKGPSLPPTTVAPQATASLPPQMDKEGMRQILERLKAPSSAPPAAPASPVTSAPAPKRMPPTMTFLPAIEDAATATPKQVSSAVMDMRRSALGRRPTDAEMNAAVEAAALEVGPDAASIVSKTGLPTREVTERLTRKLREANFRSRLPDAEARVARETAQSPVDNVSGRMSKQVAAVKQQEGWSRAFQALPPEKRADYIRQIKQETGLPDDVIRRRLKMTMAEWRRNSFDRGPAPVPKKKVIDEPIATFSPLPGVDDLSFIKTSSNDLAWFIENADEAAASALTGKTDVHFRVASKAAEEAAKRYPKGSAERLKYIKDKNNFELMSKKAPKYKSPSQSYDDAPIQPARDYGSSFDDIVSMSDDIKKGTFSLPHGEAAPPSGFWSNESPIKIPLYHNTDKNGLRSLVPNAKSGRASAEWGIYTSPKKGVAADYGRNRMTTYSNVKNPLFIEDKSGWPGGELTPTVVKDLMSKGHDSIVAGSKSMKTRRPEDAYEIIIFDPRNIYVTGK